MTESPWHQALIFALTGERRPELGTQLKPDLDRALAELDRRLGSPELLRQVESQEAQGLPWPYPVPDDLRSGLGAAQFQALLGAAVDRLGLSARTRAQRVASPRPLDADEQRLLRDVPPHHGT